MSCPPDKLPDDKLLERILHVAQLLLTQTEGQSPQCKTGHTVERNDGEESSNHHPHTTEKPE